MLFVSQLSALAFHLFIPYSIHSLLSFGLGGTLSEINLFFRKKSERGGRGVKVLNFPPNIPLPSPSAIICLLLWKIWDIIPKLRKYKINFAKYPKFSEYNLKYDLARIQLQIWPSYLAPEVTKFCPKGDCTADKYYFADSSAGGVPNIFLPKKIHPTLS